MKCGIAWARFTAILVAAFLILSGLSTAADGGRKKKKKKNRALAKAEKTISTAEKAFNRLKAKAKPPATGNGRVVGFVIDANTGAVPAGAEIIGTKGNKTQKTQPEQAGVYELEDLESGAWKLEAKAPGYATETKAAVTISPGQGPGMGAWVVFRLKKN